MPACIHYGKHLTPLYSQIKSALHRQQLTRAMKRVILGLGTAPSAPQNLRCRQVTCNSVLLTWQPPERLGHPPFHKYKLQRSEGEDSGWVSVNKNLGDEETHWEDGGLEVRLSMVSVYWHLHDLGQPLQSRTRATCC